MKVLIFFICMICFKISVVAQTQELKLSASNIEVLSTIPDLEVQKELSELEDQKKKSESSMVCGDGPKQANIDLVQEQTLIPKKLKDTGWKVLFEVKYMPEINTAGFTPLSENSNVRQKVINYNSNYLTQNNIDLTANHFNLQNYQTLSQSITYPHSYFADEKDALYSLMVNRLQLAKDNDELFKLMGEMSSQMSDSQYLEFLSSIAGWAPYGDDRAAFKQTENGGKGRISPWELMTQTKEGVCGDIHSTVAKFAEIRGFEAFTIGYAPRGGEQHIISAMVDPKNPDKVYMINYSTLEVNDLNETNSLKLSPGEDGWEDIGLQYRIFKNTKPGEDGKMQQIGSLPTPLRGFFRNLVDAQFLPKPAMPENQNFTQHKAEIAREKEVTKWQKDGDQLIKNISNGVVVYEGQADSSKIFGVAVSHEVYKTLYDEDGQAKKNKYFSLLVSGSELKPLDIDNEMQTYYVYLNMQGGRVLKLIESSHFKLGGILGYQIEGFAAFGKEDAEDPLSYWNGGADGSLDTFLQVYAEYSKGDHNLKMNIRSDFTAGLRDQNLMTDLSTIPKNVNPFINNGVALGVQHNYNLGGNKSLQTSADLSVSRLGNWVSISTGLVTPKSSIMLNYQGGAGQMRLPGNAIQSVNLVSNVVGPSRLTANYNYNTSVGNHTLSVGGFAGIQLTTPQVMPIAGGSLKLNLNTNKKSKVKY
jgi:hypothetical protein